MNSTESINWHPPQQVKNWHKLMKVETMHKTDICQLVFAYATKDDNHIYMQIHITAATSG